MFLFICIVMVVIIVVYSLLHLPVLGKAPSGKDLKILQQSVNYKNGSFQNKHFTPTITEGYSSISVTSDFIFKKFPRTRPKDTIPSIKTDIKNIPLTEDVFIWFGHSSYYIQLQGKRFLIDPVFSGNASPIVATNKSFTGSDIYTANDFPTIDFLLITHDHYDHLDYKTVVALRSNIKQVICGLGVGSHFRYWGYDSDCIIEKDWNESILLTDQITLFTVAARHFSGRSLKRNNTLWLSFILQTPHLKIFLGGDSGYDTHFKEIGNQFGGFDVAILENGQYNIAWHAIHMLPNETIQAAIDLRAKRMIPVHNSKFKLANHAWDEPMHELKKSYKENASFSLNTPKIGELVGLNDANQQFTYWWEGLE